MLLHVHRLGACVWAPCHLPGSHQDPPLARCPHVLACSLHVRSGRAEGRWQGVLDHCGFLCAAAHVVHAAHVLQHGSGGWLQVTLPLFVCVRRHEVAMRQRLYQVSWETALACFCYAGRCLHRTWPSCWQYWSQRTLCCFPTSWCGESAPLPPSPSQPTCTTVTPRACWKLVFPFPSALLASRYHAWL